MSLAQRSPVTIEATAAEGGEDLVRADTCANLKEHVRASQETDGM
jgi:hypothetical protein